MTDPHHLSVVIPSYNASGPLRSTLHALLRAFPGAEVIVVDGDSPDGSPEMVRREFPLVRLLAEKNHGFAYATNRGIEEATGDYLLLLNSDLLLSREAIISMLTQLESNHDLCAVAPVLLNPDGSRQHLFSWMYWPNWSPILKATEVPLLSGACLMTRRDVLLKIGGLDETFFLYNEEYDWCIRARRAGYRLRLIPARVVHLGGASTPGGDPAFAREMYRGFVYMLSKHFPSWVAVLLGNLMALMAFVLSSVQVTARARAGWSGFMAQMWRRAYDKSSFPVSGRGVYSATPDWARRCLVQKGQGPADSVDAEDGNVDPLPENTRP